MTRPARGPAPPSARTFDASPGLVSDVKEFAYQRILSGLSAWNRLRHARDFDDVAQFCLFIGYPRSGHSIFGALLNAHRHAVIAHELGAAQLMMAGYTRDEIYARILARAMWFDWLGNRGTYPYQVHGGHQGRFEKLRVIGDKRGGMSSRVFCVHPDRLERLRSLVRVPLRLIHVLRNPFDNVAAISIWHKRPLADSADYYFEFCERAAQISRYCDADELFDVRHEELILRPAATLTALCAFLGLEPDADYLDVCSRLVFAAPRRTRQRVAWPMALIRDIEIRARQYPFLAEYRFEPEDGLEH